MVGDTGRPDEVQGFKGRTSFRGNLSPLRGEGAALGYRHYFFVVRHANSFRFMGGVSRSVWNFPCG